MGTQDEMAAAAELRKVATEALGLLESVSVDTSSTFLGSKDCELISVKHPVGSLQISVSRPTQGGPDCAAWQSNAAPAPTAHQSSTTSGNTSRARRDVFQISWQGHTPSHRLNRYISGLISSLTGPVAYALSQSDSGRWTPEESNQRLEAAIVSGLRMMEYQDDGGKGSYLGEMLNIESSEAGSTGGDVPATANALHRAFRGSAIGNYTDITRGCLHGAYAKMHEQALSAHISHQDPGRPDQVALRDEITERLNKDMLMNPIMHARFMNSYLTACQTLGISRQQGGPGETDS